jgi:transposase InsO family protein
VIGWAKADHLRTDLVADALTAACRQRRLTRPVIFHSNRGRFRVWRAPALPAARRSERSALVELTPAGRRLVDRATKVFEAELETRIGSVIAEKDLERFAATLSALRAAGRAVSARQESA